MYKFVVLFALVAAAFAAEDMERVKKDVVVGALPYAYHGVHYGYDDGKYYPGKYEKPMVYSAGYTAGAAYPYSYSYGAYPYSYGAYPYSSYGAYPYSSYGAYPYYYGAKTIF